MDKIWYGYKGIYGVKGRTIYKWVGQNFSGLREASEHFYENEDHYMSTIEPDKWTVLHSEDEWDSCDAQQLRLLEFQMYLAGIDSL